MCYSGSCKYERDNGRDNWCTLPTGGRCPNEENEDENNDLEESEEDFDQKLKESKENN